MPTIDEVAAEIDEALEGASDGDKGRWERLKGEVKRYRERMKAVESVAELFGDDLDKFTALPDGDKQAIAQFATKYADGDLATSAAMSLQFAQVLAGDRFEELYSELTGKSDDAPEPDGDEPEEIDMAGLDESQVKQMIAEAVAEARQEMEAQQAASRQIASQLEKLGYNPDPSDPRTRAVLSLAAAGDGDLETAHKELAEIMGDPGGSPDSEAAGAAEESAGADEPSTTAPPEGVPTGGKVDPPKTFEEAGARAMDRLASIDDADLLS